MSLLSDFVFCTAEITIGRSNHFSLMRNTFLFLYYLYYIGAAQKKKYPFIAAPAASGYDGADSEVAQWQCRAEVLTYWQRTTNIRDEL
jgi:hypothetical protein